MPVQTEGGSRVPASPLCFAAPHSWVVISVPSPPFHHDPFACSSDLKSSHFMSCHFTLANFISSHLISCCVFPAFFTTSHLIPTHLMSSLLFSAHLISSRLMSTALFSLFCHLSFSHLITSHQNSSLFSFSQRLHSSQFFFNWATCHRSSETCVSSFCLISSLIFRAAALFFFDSLLFFFQLTSSFGICFLLSLHVYICWHPIKSLPLPSETPQPRTNTSSIGSWFPARSTTTHAVGLRWPRQHHPGVRARLPWKNEGQDVTTKLSCETCLKDV